MRIGFDLSPRRPELGSHGVRRAAESLFEALRRRGRFEWVPIEPESARRSHLWRQRTVPRTVRRLGLAGFHSTVSAIPLGGRFPVVQTVHELPWLHGIEEGSGRVPRLYLRAGLRRAAAVVVPSERTATDHAGISKGEGPRVHVAPWGLAPERLADLRDDDGAAASPDTILVPGGTRPKKNALALVEALARPAGAGLRLSISGPEGPGANRLAERAAQLGVGERVRFLVDPETASFDRNLRRSFAVASLADSEGYGFAPLEALAAGRPALIGAAAPSVDGARDLVTRLDPHSADEVDRALDSLRTWTPQQARAAREFAQAHSTDACASRVEACWSRVFEQGP